MPRIRVGLWVLDRSDGTLTNQHATIRLEPKVLAVLLCLVERKGAVVSHEELLRDVWKGTHVVPGVLPRTISVLRTALGDDAYHPRYIETVSKRGYRLIAGVEEIAAPRHQPRGLRVFGIAAIASLLVLVVSDGRPSRRAMAKASPHFTHQTRVGNETAFEHYRRAVDRNPASADAHAGLATTYVFRANYLPDRDRWAEAAIESAKRAVALDAHSAAAARAAAMAHLQAKRFREAEPYLRRAIELDPNDCWSPLDLGRLLMDRGDLDGALELFRARVTARPDVGSYSFLAEALWLAGRKDDAVAAAHAAAELEPFARASQMVLIKNDLVSHQHAAAQSRLTRLLEVYPDCTLCVVQLGLIEQLAGNLVAAEARYREAIAMMPPFPAASLRLAHVLTLTGRQEQATPLLRQVEQWASHTLDTSSVLFLPRWNLAVAAAIRGDRDAALEWFREAVRAGRRDSAWDAFEPMFDAVRPLPDGPLTNP